MNKEYDIYIKASGKWQRAMRFVRTVEDKVDAMNEKMAKGLKPQEARKVIKVIEKLNKELMSANKKEESERKAMEKACAALT